MPALECSQETKAFRWTLWSDKIIFRWHYGFLRKTSSSRNFCCRSRIVRCQISSNAKILKAKQQPISIFLKKTQENLEEAKKSCVFECTLRYNFTIWLRKTSLWARIWWIFDDFWLSWYVYDYDDNFSSAFRMIEPSIFLIANMNEILLFTYPTLESSSNPPTTIYFPSDRKNFVQNIIQWYFSNVSFSSFLYFFHDLLHEQWQNVKFYK